MARRIKCMFLTLRPTPEVGEEHQKFIRALKLFGRMQSPCATEDDRIILGGEPVTQVVVCGPMLMEAACCYLEENYGNVPPAWITLGSSDVDLDGLETWAAAEKTRN